MGYSLPWIRTLVHRYNQAGPEGRVDQRHRNPGGTCLFSDAQQADLLRTLDAPPDGGLCSGPKVAAWILAHTGRQVHPQRGWESLQRLQFSQRVLPPRQAKAELDAQEAFKKPSPLS